MKGGKCEARQHSMTYQRRGGASHCDGICSAQITEDARGHHLLKHGGSGTAYSSSGH